MSYIEHCRFEYDLTPIDTVLDIGGHQGNFALEIHARYGCKVVVFEPVFELCDHLAGDWCEVRKCAVGDSFRTQTVFKKGDSTGFFAGSDDHVVVKVEPICEIATRPFALTKLNCEGAEYEILESMLNLSCARNLGHIQVQFHDCVPNAVERRQSIVDRLAATHEARSVQPFVWEDYRLR